VLAEHGTFDCMDKTQEEEHRSKVRDGATKSPLSESKRHHDGSFHKYMRDKIQKLDVQFRQQSSVVGETSCPELKSLFKGVSIHVNGYTEPSHAELKRIMSMYGGSFQNYYSRSSVSHIICSNLPDAKVKQFEKERNPTPVVRPEWITACIKAKKILPVDSFILWSLRPGGPGQQKLLWATTENRASDGYDPGLLARAQKIAKRLRENCEVLKGPPKSSMDDPNFVESFYRASRLHFIGTWKTRLENLMLSDLVQKAPNPSQTQSIRTIVHVDMDCFFASVAEASHPEFKGLPLAVCHSNAKGSGEISSANYEARKFGVCASMFMAKAKELCPMLVVVPYEFEKYEAISEAMYKILFRYSSSVSPVSCDEAYMDISGLGDPMQIATSLRKDIEQETCCCASVGISTNMLLSRIATAKAKPNGQFHLQRENALQELACLDIEELPGIGWRTGKKLRAAGYNFVSDIQNSTKERLQDLLGNKLGTMAFEYAFGDDKRVVCPVTERKSVGAEINWGVRFESSEDAEKFLKSISQQVSDRLEHVKMKGKCITLKIKKRREGASEPRKFLGMGVCDSLSRATTVPSGIFKADDIYSESVSLLRILNIYHSDIRGIGLSVSKLEPLHANRKVQQINPQMRIDQFTKQAVIQTSLKGHPDNQQYKITLEPSKIDPSVLSELPADIRQEIEREYGIKNRKQTKAPGTFGKDSDRHTSTIRDDKPHLKSRRSWSDYDPLRMSQIDTNVLNELPNSLREEIIRSIDPSKKKPKRAGADKAKIQSRTKQNGIIDSLYIKCKEQRENLSGKIEQIATNLPQDARAIIQDLHMGNTIGFIAALEAYLSHHDNSEAFDHTIEDIKRIISLECGSIASNTSPEGWWIIQRGVHRLSAKFHMLRKHAPAILHILQNKMKSYHEDNVQMY
jgi:DNA repair protein REV1